MDEEPRTTSEDRHQRRRFLAEFVGWKNLQETQLCGMRVWLGTDPVSGESDEYVPPLERCGADGWWRLLCCILRELETSEEAELFGKGFIVRLWAAARKPDKGYSYQDVAEYVYDRAVQIHREARGANGDRSGDDTTEEA